MWEVGNNVRRRRGVIAGAGLSVAAGLSLAAAGSGCAASRTAVVGAGPATAPVAGGWKQVRYEKAVLDVPAAWPVIDLASHPQECVLFNTHAVYLGHQGPDARCPARALGHTEAVQVEPLDPQTRQRVLASPADATINGEAAAIEPDGSATMSLVASFGGLGVTVTATYLTEPSIATRIVQSVRIASGSAG
jgi:hypothetical protein